ncbi:hypothetical protein ACPESR_25490 [Nocardia testacea]|uniref:hypothetical protein n=1 Tax=Nocardia testacea TaxID=248551 RepID=UPI003C300D7D
MIGSKELRALADQHPGDTEFAELLRTMADRRERAFDEYVLAPSIYQLHPDIPDGASWEEQDQQVRDRVTELVTIIRTRLEELGWPRPDVPGRTWTDATDIPEGVPFTDAEFEGSWIREGDMATSLEEPDRAYKIGTIGKGSFREVLPA